MLPQIELDDERFSEIVEKARKQLPGLCPEWTDHNYHDPGITMMELLAWFKEMQQFHLDRTGEAHLLKYLKLMGYEPLKRHPAEVEIGIENLLESVYLPKGSQFFAGDICFETIEQMTLGTSKVVRLAVTGKYASSTDVTGNEMRFPAFGIYPKEGECLLIGLEGPLEPGQEQNLSLHFYRDESFVRNPIGADVDFIPLADIEFCYLGQDGWNIITGWQDTTYQMLRDGFLTFTIGESMHQGEEGIYWLRMKLKRCDYEFPPVIESIGFQQLRAEQKRTLIESYEGMLDETYSLTLHTSLAGKGCYELYIKKNNLLYKYKGRGERIDTGCGVTFRFPDLIENQEDVFFAKEESENIIYCRLICYEEEALKSLVIGEGTGLPFQEYQIGIQDLCTKGLAVMAETEEGSGCYETWESCEDFAGSGPMDRHFHFDEEKGILIFGDCDHGMAPEGKILLAAGHQSMGVRGNVKAKSISRSGENIPCELISNRRDAAGGKDTESLSECSRRMKVQLKNMNRTVTYADFEKMAKMTPGLMIENVRAIPVTKQRQQDGTFSVNTVAIVVKPSSAEENPRLNEAYRRNILRWLEPKRMIGTKIDILSPEYIGITVFVEIETNTYETAARESVRQVLTEFFHGIRAEFGTVIHYSAVYGIIDVLETVIRIKSLSIDAQGKNIRRSRNGDMVLPANGLAYFMEWSCAVCRNGG